MFIGPLIHLFNDFELPQSGGAYRVNPDGSLTIVQQPQTPATAAATYPISEE